MARCASSHLTRPAVIPTVFLQVVFSCYTSTESIDSYQPLCDPASWIPGTIRVIRSELQTIRCNTNGRPTTRYPPTFSLIPHGPISAGSPSIPPSPLPSTVLPLACGHPLHTPVALPPCPSQFSLTQLSTGSLMAVPRGGLSTMFRSQPDPRVLSLASRQSRIRCEMVSCRGSDNSFPCVHLSRHEPGLSRCTKRPAVPYAHVRRSLHRWTRQGRREPMRIKEGPPLSLTLPRGSLRTGGTCGIEGQHSQSLIDPHSKSRHLGSCRLSPTKTRQDIITSNKTKRRKRAPEPYQPRNGGEKWRKHTFHPPSMN